MVFVCLNLAPASSGLGPHQKINHLRASSTSRLACPPFAYLDIEVEEKQDEGEHVGRLKDEAAEGEATGPHHCTQRVGDGEDELHLKGERGEGRWDPREPAGRDCRVVRPREVLLTHCGSGGRNESLGCHQREWGQGQRHVPGRLRGPGRGKGVRTYQLGLGEVPLPPQVPVHGWKHRQAVVGVHEDVDEAIQGGPEETCTTVASVASPDSDLGQGPQDSSSWS